MSKIELITDTGSMIASAQSISGLQVMLDGTAMLEAPVTLTTAEATADGVINIDPEMSVYPVAVNGDAQITVDASQVAASKFDATLLLDCDNVGVISFPENFYWSGDAPTLGSNTVHAIKLSGVGGDKYLARVIGSIAKPVTSAVTYAITIDGVTTEYAEEQVNSLVLTSGNYDESLSSIQSITVSSCSISTLTMHMIADNGNCTADILGGEVSNINLVTDAWYSRCSVTINIDGGKVGSISCLDFGDIDRVSVSLTGDGELGYISIYDFSQDFNMTGGAVRSLYLEGNGSHNVTAGRVETVHVSHYGRFGIYQWENISPEVCIDTLEIGYEGVANISGHTIANLYDMGDWGTISMTSGYIGRYFSRGQGRSDITICGGSVGLLSIGDEDPTDSGGPESRVSVTLSHCEIGKLYAYLWRGIEDDSKCTANLIVGENVRVDELSIDDLTGGSQDITTEIPIGANSVVKLSTNTQSLVTSGAISINADPTATIINL